MIFYFDSLGAPVSVSPERVFQGSNRVNDIYLIAPVAPQCVASVKFALPSGETYGPEVMEKCDETSLNSSDTERGNFGIWHYLLPLSVTAEAGAVSVQFTLTGTEGDILATPAQVFLVEEGVPGEEPVKGDSYQTVLDFVAALSGKIAQVESNIVQVTTTNLESGSGSGAVQQKTYSEGSISYDGGNAEGNMSAALGCGTRAAADFSFAAGKGTVAVGEGQTVVGQYNEEDENALFSVGNGSATLKKTAFSVKKDGRASIAGTAEDDFDVANKAYVDGAINSSLKLASAENAGIVKTNESLGIDTLADGTLKTVCATAEDIAAQTDTYKPVTPSEISYAVKAGLGNAKESVTWTENEKQSARETIDALSSKDIILEGTSTPNSSTPAQFIGQRYLKNREALYTCIGINEENNVYTWREEPVTYATAALIDQQWQLNYWISPKYLAYSVKAALVNPNKSTIPASWTDEEKETARNNLGITSFYLHTITAPESNLTTRIISTEKEAFSCTAAGIVCNPEKIVSLTVKTGSKAPAGAMWYSDSPDGSAIWQAKYYDMNGTELLNINFAVVYNGVGVDSVTLYN